MSCQEARVGVHAVVEALVPRPRCTWAGGASFAANDRATTKKQKEKERRNAFVAVTRSKRLLYLVLSAPETDALAWRVAGRPFTATSKRRPCRSPEEFRLAGSRRLKVDRSDRLAPRALNFPEGDDIH